MKKIFILFLLCVAPLSAEAKSFKLGDFDLGKVFAKSHEKVCTSGDQCKSGLCVSGKCVYCDGKTNICPAGKACMMGMCTENAGCKNNSDCTVGKCDQDTLKCVDCLADADCRTSDKPGRKCVSNSCEDCASSEKCGCAVNQMANGAGGCGCADDAFNNGGTCVRYCDLTTCKDGLSKYWDGYMACCCR